MAIAVYPTYAPCRTGECKFPSPILVLDTRKIVRFVSIHSSAAATTGKNGARVLCGITNTIHPQKKEWIEWKWKAIGHLTPHNHYHWETITMCGGVNGHGIFQFDDMPPSPNINVSRCMYLTEPEYLAIFVLECLIALETKGKEFIRDDMTFVEPFEPI